MENIFIGAILTNCDTNCAGNYDLWHLREITSVTN